MRVSFGEFRLDTDERLLSKGGVPVHLTPKALALLECLVASGHGAVAKAELLGWVWPATCVSEGSLTSVVKELRKALGDSAHFPRYVRGVRGFGYAFCGDARVERAPATELAAAVAPPEFRLSWQQREVALSQGENLLGRTHQAAVWVEHPSVSRHHAVIRVTGATATIEDCGSKNGTFVGEERVEGRRELCAGDDIRLGPGVAAPRPLPGGRHHGVGRRRAPPAVAGAGAYNARMKRSWSVPLALSVLLPACQTAPKTPPAPPGPPPELLQPYQGALRLLPHQGDVRVLTVAAGRPLAGACDVAVRLTSVAFDRGEARFALEMLGQPKVGDRGVTCKRLEPAIRLVLTGLPPQLTPEVTARIDEVLLTPEAYLKAKGTAFDRPAAEPTEVASRLTDANDAERKAARGVVAWPTPLLSVDAFHKAPKKRARYERLVDFEAVVGKDGRLYRPRVKSSLDPTLERLVMDVLPLWRLEPARRADGPLAARVAQRLVLRVY